MSYRLKTKYLKAIKEDQLLFGKVAYALSIGAPSLIAPLKNNSTRLTEKRVLEVISEHLNVPENDLYEDVEETENA